MVSNSRYTLLMRSFIVLAFIVEFAVTSQNEILKSFRDFLNKLPDQQHIYKNGVVLNSENLDNNLLKITVALHKSNIDSTKAKLVRCTATVKNDGEDYYVISDNGYRCFEGLETEYTFIPLDVITENDIRKKRSPVYGDDVDEDPSDPQFTVMANSALRKFMWQSGVPSGYLLFVSSVLSAKSQLVNGTVYRISFVVSNYNNPSQNYVCQSSTWNDLDGQTNSIDVQCNPIHNGGLFG